MIRSIWIVALVVWMTFAGCAWFETQEEKTADELRIEGVEQFEKGNYRKAIKAFENLKDWYPFSKHVPLAELRIADAYFKMEEYSDAVFAYEEFETLHPRNEKTPYAVYQIAKCYFSQVDTIDRDQTPAQKALDTYNRFIRYYPDSVYYDQAVVERDKCLQSLAGNALYIAKFYYKAGHYKAALYRFRSVVTDFPDVGMHKEALDYIARCEKALQKEAAESKKKDAGPQSGERKE